MMHVSSTPQGFQASGQVAYITLPMLLGLLETAQATGQLRIDGEQAACEIGWENGSIIGIQWDGEQLNLHTENERTIVSTMVKQSGALMGINDGTFRFLSDTNPQPNFLPPGKLPLAFFIRYGLASSHNKELTNLLFENALPNGSSVVLLPECNLKALGSKAEAQLKPYRSGVTLNYQQTKDNTRQLLVALWSVSMVSVTPIGSIQVTYNQLIQRFGGGGLHQTTPKELATPFGPPPAMEEYITEMGGSAEDSYLGLLSPSNGELPSLALPPTPDIPELPESLKSDSSKDYIPNLLSHMDDWSASDIFISQDKAPAVRIHGQVLSLPLPTTSLLQIDGFLQHALTNQIQKRFQESGDLDFGYSLDAHHRFRINLYKQKGQLALVARAIPTGALDFKELRLPETLGLLASQPRGLILVTGATGSGKSTTLAAMLHYINTTRPAHIVTIEEPIEFIHNDIKARITQREVGADTQSFHSALRHVVRESPDVILIGELRDMETIQVALQAALTGHLVLASLHTVDSVQTLQRLMSYYPEHLRHQVAMDLSISLQGIISQRLIPTRKGNSRAAALEILTCTPAVAQLLKQQRIEELSDHLKMSSDPHTHSFNKSLLELYRKGVVTYEMGRAYATNPEEFSLSAQGMETGVSAFQKDDEDDASIGLDIKSLLHLALERGASDLHLTTGRPPILRIDGKLKPLPFDPLTEADMRLLLFSIIGVRQRTTYQLEREVDFALSLEGGQRFRVNAYFQKGKMAAALRAIPSQIPDPAALAIPEQVMLSADHPHGLVLIVGPTGSGKSTTLACMIDRINTSRASRIITIEDPIEFTHTSKKSTIDQREVHADTKSFASALKFILRQDPDVILIGEMRDIETISAAITAAETGHLVLATLHTNNAVQTIDRIIDVFPAHQQPQIRSQLASALVGVVSQRLLPRHDQPGRVAAFEILLANPAIRNLIREDKMHQARSIMESSRSIGMVTLDYALQELFQHGLISMEAAMRYINNPQLLSEQSKPNRSNNYYR